MATSRRRLTAEFLGTFGFVFIGGGVVVVNANEGGTIGLIGIAVAHAMAFGVFVWATTNISGGHLNPAVTLALWLAKKIDGKGAVAYVITQLIAAALAALLIKYLFPATAGEVTGLGVPRIGPDVTLWQAILIEAVLTMFLVSAVFGTVSWESPPIGAFGIGLVLLFAMLVGGPLTGAAINPARAFGPALVSWEWIGHAAYWVGPTLGALVAAFLWVKILLPYENTE